MGKLEKIEKVEEMKKKGEPRLASNLGHFGGKWMGQDFLKYFGRIAEN